eukprot:scaffold447_cov307-Pinguiococcus_pyrenoidosus.AAC.85
MKGATSKRFQAGLCASSAASSSAASDTLSEPGAMASRAFTRSALKIHDAGEASGTASGACDRRRLSDFARHFRFKSSPARWTFGSSRL